MKQRSGFTLVELSIVLVIIGLLIGGILVGQSLIDSAKINAHVSQLQQFDAGVMAFKAQYKYLPGDAPAFGGDGDGKIESNTNGDNGQQAEEIANFWSNMSPDIYASTAYGGSGLKIVTKGAGKNSPSSNLGNNLAFRASVTNTSCLTSAAVGVINYYTIVSIDSMHLESYWRFRAVGPKALKPIDLMALDKKMDDGLADSGNVVSYSMHDGWSGFGYLCDNPEPNCSSGATYTVANTGYECTPAIRIGGSTGDPQ